MRSKCYAGGQDEHVHPTLLTLRLHHARIQDFFVRVGGEGSRLN